MDEHRLGLKPILRREWVDEFSDATPRNLIGGFNGCGCMVLYIRAREKPIGGCCHL